MIVYDTKRAGGYAQHFRLRGSAIFHWRCLPQGLLAALLGLAIHRLQSEFSGINAMYIIPQVYYPSLSAVLAFLLVFRINMAYQRYWEGRTAMQTLLSKLGDIALHTKAFVLSEDHEARAWKDLMGQLLLLYLAMAIASLRGERDLEAILGKCKSLGLSLADEETAALKATNHRAFLIAGWIQRAWVRRAQQGKIDCAPPVLSRSFQVISEVQLAMNQAQKIQTTPFPFPFVQVCFLLLHVHMVTNPIVVALHASSSTMAFFVALIATLVLFALNTIAEELEEPFGMDANDLPMNHYLASFIQQLWALDLALPENAATFTCALEKVQELETEGSSGKGNDATRDEADVNDVEADLAEPSPKDATRATQEEGAAGLGAGLEYIFRLFDRQSAAPQRRFKSRESMVVLRDLRFGSRRTRSRHAALVEPTHEAVES